MKSKCFILPLLIVGISGIYQFTPMYYSHNVDIAMAKKKISKSKLKGYAQSFGRKPVDTIQSMPSTYVTTQDDDGNTIYGWHPKGLPELVRVDSQNNNTDVYIYSKKGKNKMLGKHLYHGRTIYQKPTTRVIYQ